MKEDHSHLESSTGETVASASGPEVRSEACLTRPDKVTKWLALLFLGLAILVAAGVRFRLLDFPLERDEGEYAYAGQLIQEGIPPYKLAYNMKMPGIYLAYAGIMSVFGQTTAAIHLGLLLVNLTSAGVLFLMARKWLDLTGAVVAASAYALMTLSPAYLGLAAHATQFVVLPALLGFLVIFRVEKEGKWPGCLAAGCLFGVAFLMKQQGMFLGIFGGLYLAWISLVGKMGWGRVMGRLAAYALGCMLPFLAVCLWLKIAGVFPAFWFWTFSYAREYVGVLTFREGLFYAKDTMATILQAAPWLWATAGMGLACLLLTRRSWTARVFLGGFFFFSLLAVCPGYYFREHYFIVLLPAVGLLAGLAISWSGQWLAKTCSGPMIARLPFFFGAAACAQSLHTDRAVFFSLSPLQACRVVYRTNPFPESPDIARYLEQHTGKDQRIVVIGSEPQIYFYAHRHASSGYLYSLPLLQPQPYARSMQTNMIHEIEENPPAYLVLVSSPLSWEAQEGSSHRLIDWVAGYLNQNMEQVGLIQKLDTDAPETIWGPEAAKAPLTSDWYVAVFKQVAAGETSDRAQAAARDKVLMDRFDDCVMQKEFGFYCAAMRLNPNDLGVREQFALSLLQHGRMEEAGIRFQELLRLNPDDSEACNGLGMVLASQGRMDEAMLQFQTALRLNPTNPVIHLNLGNLLARSRRNDEAISQFREALRLKPDYAVAHDNLGVLLVRQGHAEEAMSEFQQTLRVEPDSVKAHENLAFILASEGRLDEAIQQFQEVLRLSPDDASARTNLAKVLALKNQGAGPTPNPVSR